MQLNPFSLSCSLSLARLMQCKLSAENFVSWEYFTHADEARGRLSKIIEFEIQFHKFLICLKHAT